LATAAALGAALAAVATPAAANAGQLASRPLPARLSGILSNIAVSQTRVWVFTTRTSAPASIIELSKTIGRQTGTLRERQPGQSPWVAAAYRDHPWTTMVPASGVPALAEVSASGTFTHRVTLAFGITPEGPISGAAALTGSHLWAATASPPAGAPAGLVQLSASNGAQTRALPWPHALHGFAPQGMSVSGGQIWMTDGGCQIARVTTTSGGGSVIFRLPRADCRISSLPAPISVDGGHVWVQAYNTLLVNGPSLAELDARDGHLVRLISGHTYRWNLPSFVTAGPNLWVTSQTGGYHNLGFVVELSASTGQLVHRYSGPQYHFGHPFKIAAFGSHVWVLNAHSVTKL
jgi:hypothetical protein